MPKHKLTYAEKLRQWISNKQAFEISKISNEIFCKACGKIISCQKKYHIENRNQFFYDLCRAFVAADIPWKKLTNPILNEVFEKYFGKQLPEESTLRKNYLPQLYNETIENIKKNIGNQPVWIAVGETTDALGRNIANIIVCQLSEEGPGTPSLLASKALERTNSITMAQFINKSLEILWPNGIHHERVRLLLTDGAAYMVKCGKHLQIFYPKLIHLTCLAHALHLTAELVRNRYENVNSLISNVKKIFLKSPLRVEVYKDKLKETPLPPKPIITRWGNWINAVLFYNEHFEDIKEVVMLFDPTAAQSIAKAQQCMKLPTIRNELTYISAHFKILSDGIKKLETFGLPLHESIREVESIQEYLGQAPGEPAKQAFTKLASLLTKNHGYAAVTKINNVLSGSSMESIQDPKIDENVIHKFKYAPITSCDVERSFSKYKNMLTDKRMSFTPDNLEKTLVCYSNSML